MKKEQTPIKLLYAAPSFGPRPGSDGPDEPAGEAEEPGLPYPANYTEPEEPDEDTLTEDVYNGPGMMGFGDEEPEEADEPEEPEEPEEPDPFEKDVPMAPVYAGPEFFEERERRFKSRRKAMECVYAGPDYFAGRAPRTGRVYAAPPPPPAPENKNGGDREKLMQGVYAVPRPDLTNQSMMAVYAGPEIMSNSASVLPGAFAPDPVKDPADLGRCPICGGKVSQTARFCETCGAKLGGAKPDDPNGTGDGSAVFCSCCGARIPASSPFCPECGTPVPNGKREPVFQSVYACPPLLKKGGKEPPRKGLFTKLFKKEKK